MCQCNSQFLVRHCEHRKVRGNLFIGESFSRSLAHEKIPTSDLAVFLGMMRCGLETLCISWEIATSLALLAMTDEAIHDSQFTIPCASLRAP